jgi:hypothetical protein
MRHVGAAGQELAEDVGAPVLDGHVHRREVGPIGDVDLRAGVEQAPNGPHVIILAEEMELGSAEAVSLVHVHVSLQAGWPLDATTWSPSHERNESAIRTHLLPSVVARFRLADLTGGDGEAFLLAKEKSDGLSAQTVNGPGSCLRIRSPAGTRRPLIRSWPHRAPWIASRLLTPC